jgi:RsiW-degrading membrane proteinase PrsW (M82 family)
MLRDGRFWHLFIVPIILHMVWNTNFTLPYNLKYIGIGILAWVVILALIQEGLKEIREEKNYSLKEHENL